MAASYDFMQGFMAVIVVSSGIALAAMQGHKRLTSDFINKLQPSIGGGEKPRKKKVRFAADVVKPSSNNKEYRREAKDVKHGLGRV